MLLIPSLKKKTKQIEIAVLPDPPLLYMPLGSYQGEMRVLVKDGDPVHMYQVLAESTGFLASKLHAPLSGSVVGLTEISGERFLMIKNDFCYREQQRSIPDIQNFARADFLQVLREAGVEGSGGARFPTHVKFKDEDVSINTFIINGAECEPYLSADYVLMKHMSDKLMSVLEVVQRVVAPKEIVFAIEQQNKELGDLLREASSTYKLPVSVKILPNTYPQGGELQLIKAVTGLEISKGSIPAQYGLMVSNVGTLSAMYTALFEGKPYTERVITVSGNLSKTLGNYRVKIGTPVGHILKETDNAWDAERQTVIMGGAMMGKEAVSPLSPIHKGVGGLLILPNPDSKAMNCISCGYCVDVCPQRLMPLEFVRHNQEGDIAQLKSYHLDDCILCGACAYVCPSDVPLMHHIKSGKAKLQGEGRRI